MKGGLLAGRDVKTVRDLIHHRYLCLLARQALGPNARQGSRSFVRGKLRDLRAGALRWTDVTREKGRVSLGRACAYCGSKESLTREHVVPRSLRVTGDCATCGNLREMNNLIWVCAPCRKAKKQLGLYAFFRRKYPGDKRYFDRIPSGVEKKYLKTIYECHTCAGTLDAPDADGDGKMTLLDIDHCVATHT